MDTQVTSSGASQLGMRPTVTERWTGSVQDQQAAVDLCRALGFDAGRVTEINLKTSGRGLHVELTRLA